MPAIRSDNDTIETAEFDVLGEDHGRPHFIRHIGLSATTRESVRERVPVHEMGPPLQSAGFIRADVFGTAALNDDELRKIRSFIDRHKGEHAARRMGSFSGYCVYPHAREETEHDGTHVYTRFSCAGFVIEAYRFGGIDLIDLEKVPPVAIEDVADAYPEFREKLTEQKWQKRLGIDVGFPLQIVFCGYVIHAMNRTAEEIREGRYAPSVSNCTFP